MTKSLTWAQLFGELRAMYLGKKAWIEICADGKGYAARDELWHHQQRGQLRALVELGRVLKIIVENSESFDRWLEERAGEHHEVQVDERESH